MIVVGAVIGSGIFLMPKKITAALQENWALILSLWVICGLVNLCGALTLAELAAMMPHAGGTYVYLREAYGKVCAFLWGWSEFWVIRSGAIAGLAVATVFPLADLVYLTAQYKLLWWHEMLCACGIVAGLTAVNVIGTYWGGLVQSVTTAMKVVFVAVLAMFPFFIPWTETVELQGGWPPAAQWQDLAFYALIGSALSGIMWTYDGWGNLGVVAEEIKQPQTSIPRALGLGVVLLIVLYTGVNIAYYKILPWETITQENVTAYAVAEKVSPTYGQPLMLSILMISVLGALNANILVGPRVLFAMARDGVFLSSFKAIHATRRTPVVAILGLSLWSMVLIVLGALALEYQEQLIQYGLLPADGLFHRYNRLFDVLTSYCIFGGSIFYFLAVLAVFVLRFTNPEAERPYRTWGYPIVPGIFVLSYLILLGLLMASQPTEAISGLTLIAIGFVVYLLNAPAGVKRAD